MRNIKSKPRNLETGILETRKTEFQTTDSRKPEIPET